MSEDSAEAIRPNDVVDDNTAGIPVETRPQNPLAERFLQIRRNAEERKDKAKQIALAGKPIEVVLEIKSPEEAVRELRELEQSSADLDTSFLQKAQTTINRTSNSIAGINREKTKLDAENSDEMRKREVTIRVLTDRIDTENKTFGLLRKLMNIPNRRHDEAEIARLKSESEKLNTDYWERVKAITPIHDEMSDRVFSISIWQKEVVAHQSKDLVEGILKDYTDFEKQLEADPDLSREVMGMYIDRYITPELEREWRAEIDVLRVREKLQEFRDKYGTPEQEAVAGELLKMTDRYKGFGANIFTLVGGQGEVVIIKTLVADLAHQEIEDLKRVASEWPQDWGEVFDHTLKSTLPGHKGENYIFSEVGSVVSYTRKDDEYLYPMPLTAGHLDYRTMPGSQFWGAKDLGFWKVLVDSSTAQQIFGDKLREKDNIIFNEFLENSLGHGMQSESINKLIYYPNPETVRVLVLISAADHQFYGTDSANRVLYDFSQQENWQKLLSETVAKYPELAKAQPFLERVPRVVMGQYPGIQEATVDFSLSIINNPNASDKEKNLAYHALPNDNLLHFLEQKGFLSVGISDELLSTIALLKSLNPKGYAFTAALSSTARTTAFKILDESLTNSEMKKDFRGEISRLTQLSRYIKDSINKPEELAYLTSHETVKHVLDGKCSLEIISAFPKNARNLMGEEMKGLRELIFDNGKTLMKDESDIKFLSGLVGRFGNKSEVLISEYANCLRLRAITTEKKALVLEFLDNFRVLSPNLIKGYVEAKNGGFDKIYITHLNQMAEKVIGNTPLTEEERNRLYYKDILRHVYPNHSGQWTNEASNESCEDRLRDLTGLKIYPKYEIDLLSASSVSVKEGQAIDVEAVKGLEANLLSYAKIAETHGFDQEKILKSLDEEIDKSLVEVLATGNYGKIDLEVFRNRDEKLFLLLLDNTYGGGIVAPNRIKELIVGYEFGQFEDIREYITGTSDRVARASNQDYALLCELHTFYSDRIKEVNKRIVESGVENPALKTLLPDMFNKWTSSEISVQRRDLLARLQIDKLGLTDGFVRQITKALESKGRKYTPDQIARIIHLYEARTGGLQDKTTTSKNRRTIAFYGQLKSQREKTIQALRTIEDSDITSADFHLEDADFTQGFDIEQRLVEGKYDEEQFTAYTARRFIDVFSQEKQDIEIELGKFQSEAGKNREVINGYITKTKESANARQVGGVCVAGDNPFKNRERNMWDMPNYLQLVLQEPDTLQCQGVVLMHQIEDNGKKILSVSLNPSSTYLYSVDEAAMFNGLMSTVEQFSRDNGFDMIVVSKNKQIRTNRTGGTFEKTLDARIATVNETLKFSTPQQFSYTPTYLLEDMDVLWKAQDLSQPN